MEIREEIRIRGNTPFVAPRVGGSEGSDNPLARCVLDTGCPFNLMVSPEVAGEMRRSRYLFHQDVRDIHLADGTPKGTQVCRGEIYWLSDQPRQIDVVVMDPCPDPCLGLPLLRHAKIVLGAKSGYVEALSELD